ncbi:MAG: hypothetical protein KDA75_01210, partial [Planctomycetaceae bacterium]|nr:hypothetical protein [Planctomycetaceae bacterium]
STAVLDAIRRLQPQLTVCGHIYASAGRSEMIGRTPVVNAGPKGMIWTLES